MPELHKKWHLEVGEEQAVPVNGVVADVRANGKADVLTRAERPPQSVRTLEPPPLTQFEEDHFVAAAEA